MPELSRRAQTAAAPLDDKTLESPTAPSGAVQSLKPGRKRMRTGANKGERRPTADARLKPAADQVRSHAKRRSSKDEDGAGDTRTVTERRQAQIVRAAIRLFSERGYFQTTIDDIADAIGVSKGLIYRYFKDKNDLLFYSLRYVHEKYRADEIPDLIAAIGPLGALIKVMSLHCHLAKDHTLEVVLAYRSTTDLLPEQRRHLKILESKTARMIRQCLEACVHGGLMHSVNTDIMSYQYLMFGHTWALKNWAFRDRHSVDEYMAEGENVLVRPFLTPAGLEELKKIKQDA